MLSSHAFILSVFMLVETTVIRRDRTEEITISSSVNETSSLVEIGFLPRGGESGVIEIFLPNSSAPRYLCYPDSFLQHQEAARLLHVLCKQLHYVTFSNRYKESYLKDRLGVLSTSAQCTGLEDTVSQCPWSNVKTERCRDVLGARCTSCYQKISASNGSINNPGFPHTYLYSLTCDWTIEVPDERGVLLTFEQFALPHHEKKCESYIELAYGDQKSLTNQRICPSDLPGVVSIPFQIVRVRFSSGNFLPEYGRQQTHYGFNLVFRAIILDAPNNTTVKALVISFIILLFLAICIVCYCCGGRIRQIGGRISAAGTYAEPPNAPTQEELQATFEFYRGATQQIPQNSHMDFSIYQSENSSTDSNVARWRSHSDLPVTSALAPLGPECRKVSIASTPRTVFTRRKLSDESARRIHQIRTRLVARFSCSSTSNVADASVYFSSSDRNSYSKLSCEEEIPRDDNEDKPTFKDKAESQEVPSIVIEFVE